MTINIENKTIEDKTWTISGKELGDFLNSKPINYNILYPRRFEREYCPCKDLLIENEKCQGMYTVMDVLRKKQIKGFPKQILKNTGLGKYRSGEVWVDDKSNIAYLYLGKTLDGSDVVINLGGETFRKGEIQTGHINDREDNEIFFETRVFPKGH